VVSSIFSTFVHFFPVLIPGKTPLMILSNATLFPGAILPLHIFEPRYGRMLSDVLESHRMFAIAMRRPGARREVPMPVACLGVVRVCVEVLESLDIKSRLVNVSHFLSMEFERNNMGPKGYS
jgi:Lon protease-like protein